MKTRELRDLRSKDADDLAQLLNEKQGELMNMRFQHATGALESTARLGMLKRDIARIHTVLNERRTAGESAE